MQRLNLGPQSQAMLRKAGITQLGQLQQMGSVRAYALIKQHSPQASLNLLWALEGALSNLHWQVVARDHRTSLLLALEQHMLQVRNKSGVAPCDRSASEPLS
jgi:DNA transformation protein and related proteins